MKVPIIIQETQSWAARVQEGFAGRQITRHLQDSAQHMQALIRREIEIQGGEPTIDQTRALTLLDGYIDQINRATNR